LGREEEADGEGEENAEAAMDVATAVEEKAEGNAEKVSAANDIPEASQPTDMI
jgi:hypothetical protein